MSRPRLVTTDPQLARRRAQYRNAKARKRGLAATPAVGPGPSYVPVMVFVGHQWRAAIIDGQGRRVFV